MKSENHGLWAAFCSKNVIFWVVENVSAEVNNDKGIPLGWNQLGKSFAGIQICVFLVNIRIFFSVTQKLDR